MTNRIVQSIYDLKDNVSGKLRSIGEALGLHARESTKTADSVERNNKRASDSYRQTADAVGFLRENLGKIAAAAAAAMAAMKLMEIGKEQMQGAANVEQSLARVKAIAVSTADDFGRLSEQINRSAAAAHVGAVEAAVAAAALAEQGQSAAEIFQTLTPTLLLAKAGTLEVAEAAGIVDDALDLFGKSAEDAGLMVDQLVAASKGSKEGLNGLATAVRALAPDARALGMDFEDLAGLIGLFGQNGIDAGKAAKGLRAIFQDLEDPTSKFSMALANLGDSSGSFTRAIETLRASGKRGEDALMSLDGATRSLVLFLLQQAPGAANAFIASLGQVSGTASKTAAVLSDTLLGAFGDFRDALDTLGQGLMATSLAPLRVELQKLAQQLTVFADSPDFQRLKTALTGVFEEGTAAFDTFIQSLDWSGLVDTAESAFRDAGSTLKTFKDDLVTVAQALNTVAVAIGITASVIELAMSALKVSVASPIAGTVGVLAELAETIDRARGKSSDLTLAIGSLRDATLGLVKGGLDDGNAALEDLLRRLGTTGDAAGHAASGLGQVEGAARVAGAAAATVAPSFNAVTGSAENAAAALGILPELFRNEAAATSAATAAHVTHAEKIAAAREAVETARESLLRLATSGERNSAAFQTAAVALQAAQAELTRLTSKSDEAALAQRGLEQAFRALRITSQAELVALARSAETNFAAIKQAYQAGSASIEDLRRAFAAYAQQQRAAAADSDQWVKSQLEAQLAVEASSLGLADAMQRVGATGKEAGEQTAAAFDKARDSISATTAATDDLHAAALSTKESMSSMGTAANTSAIALGGVVAMTIDQQKAMRQLNEELVRSGTLQNVSLADAKYLLETLGGLIGGSAQILATRINELEAAAQQAEDVARRMADEAASLQDQIDQLEGNANAIEDRRHQRKLADLRAEAEAEGLSHAAAYRNLVDLENKLHELKVKNLRDEANARSRATAPANERSSNMDSSRPARQENRNAAERDPPQYMPSTQYRAPAANVVLNAVLLSGNRAAVDELAELLVRPIRELNRRIDLRSL